MSVPNHRRSVAAARSLVCALTALAVATASCVSTHQVPATMTPAGQTAAWQVRPGEKIRVTMKDGWIGTFTVRSVAADGIVTSDGTRLEHTNIKAVERRRVNTGKTVFLIGGIALGVLLVVGAAYASAASGLLGGGGSSPDR